MVDNRTVSLAMELFHYRMMSLYELSLNTGVEKNLVLESIEYMNGLLEENGLPMISLEKGIYTVPESLLLRVDEVFELFTSENISLTQEERMWMIYLYTFCRHDFISNFHYQDLLSRSRNTILSDIKALKVLCMEGEVEFVYQRSRGYYLVGESSQKHCLALRAIACLLSKPIGRWALDYILTAWQEVNAIQSLQEVAQDFIRENGLVALEQRLEADLYFLQFFAIRYKRVQQEIPPSVLVGSSIVSDLTNRLLQEVAYIYTVEELQIPAVADYLTGLFRGCFEGDIREVNFFFEELTIQIVEEMERLSLIEFHQRADMIAGLQRHLIPAYYRLKSNLYSEMAYTEVIKTEHAHLFSLVKKALRPLEKQLQMEIPDSEVSYFVIHFGGYLESEKAIPYRYTALVICPNGVSSSLILKEYLKQLFPNIAFRDTRGVMEMQALDASPYDLIFSTIPVETRKPVYFVPQVMNEVQQRELFRLVSHRFPNAGQFPVEVEQLLEVIKKYGSVHKEQDLKYELVRFLNQQRENRKDEKPMLHELITKETYKKTDKKLKWQEAIALAAEPLLEKGNIEPGYIDAMIQKVTEFGPFIDIGKGVAIPHARPDEGVNQVGMSVLSLENPVYLLDDPSHEIRLIICIAAVDNQTHLKALSHLTVILRDAANIQRLVAAETFEEIEPLLIEEGK